MSKYLDALAVFALDRFTKWLIESQTVEGWSHTVIGGFFDLVHARNRGIVFSILNDSAWQYRTAALIAFQLLAVAAIAVALHRMKLFPLAFILGGALGNVYDRIAFGSVTDFLDFSIAGYHWPAFNVADSSLVIGCVLILLSHATRTNPHR